MVLPLRRLLPGPAPRCSRPLRRAVGARSGRPARLAVGARSGRPARLAGAARAVAVAVALLAAAGCGASADAAGVDGVTTTPGPTVAPEALGGAYAVAGLRIGGVDQTLSNPTKVVIDAQFGAFTLDTGCGELLGAYTLRADGLAGVTLAGGSVGNCTGAARTEHDRVVATLGAVTRWSQAGSTLLLATPTGDQVTLARR